MHTLTLQRFTARLPLLVALFGVCVGFLPPFASMALAGTTIAALNVPQRITLADTNNTCLTLPRGTEYLRIRPITSEAYLEIDGTDGGAKGAASYETYSADTDNYRAVHMYGRTGEVCLSGSAAAVVEITALSAGH